MNSINSSNNSITDHLHKASIKAGLNPIALISVRAWLADQLVAHEYAKLGQGGHTHTDIPLRKVFVDLPIMANPSAIMYHEHNELFLNLLLNESPSDLKESFKNKNTGDTDTSNTDTHNEDDESINIAETYAMPRYRRNSSRLGAVLLIGGPGQGKSTLGQLACQLHRAALLKPTVGELSTLQRELVHSFDFESQDLESHHQSTLHIPKNPLLPLQVSLPDLSAWLIRQKPNINTSESPAILRFIADLPSANEHKLSAETLMTLATHLPTLLVLDGFDEVGATKDRERIVTIARELLISLANKGAFAQVLATTRPQGYADELSQIGIRFRKLYLAPLQMDEALTYAGKLIEAKIPGADERQKALAQLHAAAAEPATERLMTTPLQVTILAALVQQLGRAPRERWNLFSRYFDYTYDREVERNTYASALLAEHRSHIERIHARVALLLQVEAERHGGAAARMTKARLEEVIAAVLEEDEVSANQHESLIRDIAAAAELRLVFLVEPEPGSFGFEIRSLQEFMAARALTSGRDSEVEARLQQIAKAPMFRNVALFSASRLFSEGSPLRDVLANRICGSLDDDPSDELTSLTRAGAIFALETLEEGAVVSQPKRARALMARAVSLLVLPPGSEHIRLARVANSDTITVLIEALERELVTAKTGENCNELATWVCILDAINRDEKWAINIGNNYWHHLQRASELLSTCNRLEIPMGEWLQKKIISRSEIISPENFINLIPINKENKNHNNCIEWLTSIYGVHSMSERRRYDVNNSLIHKRKCQEISKIQVDFMPPSWHIWTTAAMFEINPNAQSLAVILDAIADNYSSSQWKFLERISSWPLSICLASANSAIDLNRYSALLREKKLGNIEDWYTAEKGWRRKINYLVLIDSINDKTPWDINSINQNPPLLGISSWRLMTQVTKSMRNPSASDLLQKANHAFETCNSIAIKKRIAEFCLVIMSVLTTKKIKSNLNPIAWINAAPSSATLLIPRPKSLSPSKWIELLDACDHNPKMSLFFRFNQNLNSLAESNAHPVLLHLMIQSIIFYTDHSFPFDEITPENIDSAKKALENISGLTPTARANLAILKFFLGTAPATQDDELLRDISAVANYSLDYWSALLSILSVSRLPQSRVNILLAKAYTIMRSTHQHASTAVKLMRDALQKKTSDLENQSTWNRLALPLPYPSRPLMPMFTGGIPATPVHIKSIEFKNIRGLLNLKIKFNAPKSNLGQWAIILGPNGVGKTTLLRSFALALRSMKHPAIWPNGVFANGWQSVPIEGESRVIDSSITVALGDGIEHRTLIRPGGQINITQSPEQDNPRLFPLFAYGCRRGSALGGAAKKVNINEDGGPEIATLFDEGSDLIQAETWLVSLEGDISKNHRSNVIYHIIIKALCDLLNLISIKVKDQKLWVTERDHPELPFQSLSDGYLTSAGWFLDLVARWVALAESAGQPIQSDFLTQMRGLVLIDEIDLHLHPKWQIEIIGRTRRLLPQMSFIVTTHNPLTLVGAEADEIWILSNDDGQVTATCGVEHPMLLTGGQIYRHYFQIHDIYPNGIGRSLQRYSFLSGYALRNDIEQAELEALQSQLREIGLDPGWIVVERVTAEATLNREVSENSVLRGKVGLP